MASFSAGAHEEYENVDFANYRLDIVINSSSLANSLSAHEASMSLVRSTVLIKSGLTP